MSRRVGVSKLTTTGMACWHKKTAQKRRAEGSDDEDNDGNISNLTRYHPCQKIRAIRSIARLHPCNERDGVRKGQSPVLRYTAKENMLHSRTVRSEPPFQRCLLAGSSEATSSCTRSLACIRQSHHALPLDRFRRVYCVSRRLPQTWRWVVCSYNCLPRSPLGLRRYLAP